MGWKKYERKDKYANHLSTVDLRLSKYRGRFVSERLGANYGKREKRGEKRRKERREN